MREGAWIEVEIRAEARRGKGLERRADIGIALDGDADRVVITDERGQLVDGDQLLAVIAECWHKDGRLAGRETDRRAEEGLAGL